MKPRGSILRAATAGVLALLASAAPAAAGWSHQPDLVEAFYGGNAHTSQGSVVRTSNDEFFLLFGGYFPCMAQRVGADGTPLWPLADWPTAGGDAAGNQPWTHVLAPDGAGGAYHLGRTSIESGRALVLSHLDAAGGPDWGASALTLEPSASSPLEGHDLVTDGASAWVAWSGGTVVRLRRLVGAADAPGWTSAGRVFDATLPALLPDGTGGVYLLDADATTARVHRVRADGTDAPGWPAAGPALGPASAFGSFMMKPVLLRSGADHGIAVWSSDFGGAIVVQRFGADGTLDPAWPAAGVQVGTPVAGMSGYGANDAPARVCSDDQGGVHVIWRDATTLMPTWVHVLANGQLAPGFTSAGRSPLPPSATFDPADETGLAPSVNGGLLFGWLDSHNPYSKSVKLAWWLPGGAADPAEADTGRVVAGDAELILALEPDHAGGAWVLWKGLTGPGNLGNQFHYMNHETRSGLVLSAPPVAATPLSLSAPWPNPARGSLNVRCALPDARAARLSLYDVSGRAVREQAVHGAGAHTVSVERAGDLAPGVYLLRLTQGGAVRTARVAIVR